MEHVFITPNELERLIQNSVDKAFKAKAENQPKKEDSDFLSEFIPKSEVRGKLASASTLWKYEKEGRIQAYAIGGKRFYKKSEIEAALVKLNKKGVEI